MIREAISMVIKGENLSSEAAGAVMEQVMEGKATDAQIGSFLTALRMKGETSDEIFGCARVMREKASPVEVKGSMVIDTCGTGGDCSGTFNISTTAAFVAAGSGLTVAKHGNSSVSSKSGSADVLKALGVKIDLEPKDVERVLDEIGLGFLYAPVFHKSMRYAIGPRREIGIRSVFNILGPLTNPARARFQVLGVYDQSLTEPLARVLESLGVESACVVHGFGGLDEVSPLGPTKFTHFKNGVFKTFYLNPEDFGFPRRAMADIKGDDANYNAEVTLRVLKGEKGPYRETVLLNASAAFFAAGLVDNFHQGIKLGEEIIDSGKALRKLEELINVSNSRLEQGATV